MDHHGAPTRPPSGADGAAEVVGPAQPVRRGQHEVVTVEDVAQAARRWRPLLRREAMMARPARVRIRRRKPCFLCRRRLFGWNVRLLTGMTPVRVSRSHCRQTHRWIRRWYGSCRSTEKRSPHRAQHETAGSTPTDPRYAAACGRVKPVIPMVIHRTVDNWDHSGIASSDPSRSVWTTTHGHSHHDHVPTSTRHAVRCSQIGPESLWMTA